MYCVRDVDNFVATNCNGHYKLFGGLDDALDFAEQMETLTGEHYAVVDDYTGIVYRQ